MMAACLGVGFSVAVFAGSSTITITPPVVTAYGPFSGAQLDDLNNTISAAFATIQTQVNSNVGNFHDLTQLSEGFANANMAAFDNASLLGYQTYDLFAITGGANISAAVPGLSVVAVQSALNDIATNGDGYGGVGTGGFAAQVGFNAGFLVKDLYLTGRIGVFPSVNSNGYTFKQSMFGLGANYTLIKPTDLGFGFLKWRGVSVGTGIIYNNATIGASVPIDDRSQVISYFDPTLGQIDAVAQTTNTKVTLDIKSSSLVIPVDLMTSLQLLWFLNIGLGVGADLSFSSATVGLGGDSVVDITGLSGATVDPGSVDLVATDSSGKGAVFVPRLAASLGMGIGPVKLDFPVSFYPTTKAITLGATVGIVW